MMVRSRLRGFARFLNASPEHSKCEAEALLKLSALRVGYTTWTSSSMTARAIVHILNEIVINRRLRVLELGMGLSTLYIASLMKELEDVSFLSVDHDAGWIDICRKQLAVKHLVTSRHSIVLAPLSRRVGDDGEETEWYDLERITDAAASFKPDLVVIDGPPAWEEDKQRARLPAFEFLKTIVDDDTTLFVDDYLRLGEAELVTLFVRQQGWSVFLRDPDANVAILRNSTCGYNIA